MQRAVQYLYDHYAETITLEGIAEALHVSPYYLSHVFSREKKFSLFSFLSQLRMDRARELLAEGECTVKEVAGAVGFGDPNYFSKVFKRRFGSSPTQYARTSAKSGV
jgi:two-component system response regulator YesN